MGDTVIENNNVTLIGKITGDKKFSHEVYGENFYTYNFEVARLSDNVDNIPVMISDRLIDLDSLESDKLYQINGNFRSYNKHSDTEGARAKLILSVFAREIFVHEGDVASAGRNSNLIELDGFIVKEPVYRKTPLNREICDLLIAVNRPYGKSDYIPCICWGRNALFAASCQVSDHVALAGRIQSREYNKKMPDETIEVRTAYEVSVQRISLVN